MNDKYKRLIAAGTAGVSISWALAGCSDSQPRDDAGPARTSSGRSAESASPAGSYTDGRYRARGWYGNGPSSIDVSVALADGRITDVDVTPRATNPTSLDFQQRFAQAVPEVVVGRPVDEVRVSRLAGSSGTPDGFNDAIRQIRSQAAR